MKVRRLSTTLCHMLLSDNFSRQSVISMTLVCELVYIFPMKKISTIWYEHDSKCTHFSADHFSQLLAGYIISIRVEIWAHKPGLALLLVLCIEVPVQNNEMIGDVYY